MLTTIASTALVERLAETHDATAWQQFSSRYEPVLLAFARRAGLRDADARDVVQDTLLVFVTAFRNGEYDADRGRLRAWLKGIAFNRIRQMRDKVARRERQMPDDGTRTAAINRVPDDQDLDEVFEQEWQRGIVAECLREARRAVDPQTYEAFELYTLQGLPPQRVADQLGITRNAVYIAKSRVVSHARSIREQMEEIW